MMASSPDPSGPGGSPKLKAPKATFPASLSISGQLAGTPTERPVLPRKSPSVTPSTVIVVVM